MQTDSKLVRLFSSHVAPLLAGVHDKPVRRVAAAYHLALYPIHWTARKVHRHHKRVVKLSIGGAIATMGVIMAAHPVEIIPHILWDGVAYGLHGYGALPFIKLSCKFLDLEDIE